MASCAFCPDPLDADDETVYHEVKSWVTGPKLDGPVLRKQTGALAHRKCIQALMHGQAPDQPPLFEDEPKSIRRCEALAVRGGTGICDAVLDEHENCPNGDNHVW